MNLVKALVLFTLVFGMISCKENHFKADKTFAGGIKVSKEVLNLGKSTYAEYCIQCHGVNGDGNGPAAKGLIPPPRNLTTGQYKFGRVVAGDLPHDSHIARLIVKGLNGSAMLPWDIEEPRLNAVIQYIKTFAPAVWEEEGAQLGEELKPTKDPYGIAHREFAIQKGKEVYHAVAQCYTCHRAYEPKSEIQKWQRKYNGEAEELDDEIYELKGQDTDYAYKALPPDFTWHKLRSIYDKTRVEDLYIRLASGVNGAAMPSWKGVIEEDEIWALAYYVEHLMSLKGTAGRKELLGKLPK